VAEKTQDITLRVDIRQPDGSQFRGKVDIECKHQALSDHRIIRGIDASRTIDISGLKRAPQGLYQITVTPVDVFAPESQFVSIPASGFAAAQFILGKIREKNMASVILFGGGDGGGLIIGPNGVRPIPPFDPFLRLQLRGLSALLQGTTGMPERLQGEMASLTTRVSNLVVEQVEGVVGKLDADNSLIYQDADGGFTCGSTGRPPIPIPWPPSKMPSLSDLLRGGVFERELIDLIGMASAQQIAITELLESPQEVAHRLGIAISTRTAQDLQQLAPSHVAEVQDPVNKEIVQFFHKVAEDGRFLATWATRPAEAASQLGVQISDRAFDRLVAGAAGMPLGPGAVSSPVAVAVAVGITIMLVTDEPGRVLPVLDRSGIVKF
jgi:hypothetical protein